MSIVTDRHAHQYTGQTPATAWQRTRDSLGDLQRRRDRALAARNEAAGAAHLASLGLHAAKMHGNVEAMLRASQTYRRASAHQTETEAEYVAVLAEIEELLAADLSAELAGVA